MNKLLGNKSYKIMMESPLWFLVQSSPPKVVTTTCITLFSIKTPTATTSSLYLVFFAQIPIVELSNTALTLRWAIPGMEVGISVQKK